jgi:hypothetical protein
LSAPPSEEITVNLNIPAIDPGRITAADLEAARKHSAGTVRPVPAGCGQQRWPERRVNWPDTIQTDYPPLAAEACTEIGHQDAAESFLRHRRARATVGSALLLLAAGYLANLVWPLI